MNRSRCGSAKQETTWLGWLLTAIAASLGSAFWFDTLKRIVSIHSSGRKSGKK